MSMHRRPRVVDAFPFFNELDVLEIRLEELREVVDRVVIAEAPRTHRGFSKPYFLEGEEGRAVLARRSAESVCVVQVDDLPLPDAEVPPLHPMEPVTAGPWKGGPWVAENFQRNALLRGMDGLDDEDVVLISDVDEIPRAEAVLSAVQLLEANPELRTVHLHQTTYHGWANNAPHGSTENAQWVGTVVLRMGLLRELSPQLVRNLRYSPGVLKGVVLQNAGWHLTWMGGMVARTQKLATAFSHTEWVTDENDIYRNKTPKIEVCRDNTHNDLDWRQSQNICVREGRYGDLASSIALLQHVPATGPITLDLPGHLLASARGKFGYFFLCDESESDATGPESGSEL